MTDDEINSSLFGHVAKPQVQAPVEQTVAVPLQAAPRVAPAPKTPQAAVGSVPVPQAPMPDTEALAKQAAQSSNIVNREIEQPVVKPGLSSLHEAYPWLAPMLGAAGAALIGQGVYKAATSGEKKPSSISDRMFKNEPTLDSERFGGLTPPKAAAAEAQAPQFSGPETTPAEVAAVQDPAKVMQTPEQVRKEKQAQAQAKIEGRAIPSPVVTQPPSVPVVAAPQQPVAPAPASYPSGITPETEVGKAPKEMGMIQQSEYNKESKAVDQSLKQQGAVTPASKVKKPAVPSFKTAADIPEGMVFRPDVGNLDRGLVNILGPEGRLYAKEVLNEGKMFGHAGADYNQKVKELVGKYGEELKKITPSIDLTTREGRIAVGAPHTENYGSALGKAAKVGGVLGTLMTIAQSANAREVARNVGESLLPIAATPSELQPGTLTAKQLKAFEEAQKLGSPYRSVPPPR